MSSRVDDLRVELLTWTSADDLRALYDVVGQRLAYLAGPKDADQVASEVAGVLVGARAELDEKFPAKG